MSEPREWTLEYGESPDFVDVKISSEIADIIPFEAVVLIERRQYDALKEKYEKAQATFNRILMLSSGELAYTSEFTEKVKALCYTALKDGK